MKKYKNLFLYFEFFVFAFCFSSEFSAGVLVCANWEGGSNTQNVVLGHFR
jgi:hypothetical protein